MDINKRNFLKTTGLSTIAGLSAASILGPFLSEKLKGSALAAEPEQNSKALDPPLTRNRLGMIINQQAFIANPELAQECIDTCHKIHNVPDYQNPKEDIHWLRKMDYSQAFPGTDASSIGREFGSEDILAMCNHCDNPPCVRVCPTKASFKNKDGLVLIDYKRCIGCQLCISACPFGARSFNWVDPLSQDENSRYFIDQTTINTQYPIRTPGVVEKCDFCVDRLKVGKMPACVEVAFRENGIIFGDLNDPESPVSYLLANASSLQRQPELGTHPSVFYIF